MNNKIIEEYSNLINDRYVSDEFWTEIHFKEKSGYLARHKGQQDGWKKNKPNPPTKEGFYFKEYMQFYETYFNDLPF